MAKAAGKPFCLNVNISDPHKPFFGINSKGKLVDDKNIPSHVFESSEVPIPGFLFDHPDVRLELAHYYSSVRRADDCFAATMKALTESGQADNTVIMFLSDHGMPLPFAKTALWHHSTHTPWIVCWPGVTKPGYVDRKHMISAVDLMPTVLEIAGIEAPDVFDGHSFLPTIQGKSQDDREAVYKVYNENSGGNRSPMRSVETKKYGYLFNPWVDGKRSFATATKGTMTYRAMQKLAATDPEIAARLNLFDHGVREELYDYESDPNALNNLIDDPKYAAVLTKLRGSMRQFMEESKDPVLEVFDQREDDVRVSAYVDRVQAVSDKRRQKRRKQRPPKTQRKQNVNLFDLQLPESVQQGQAVEVVINHKLTKEVGKQDFHVTLKNAQGERVDRKVVQAAGKGSLKVPFKLPADFQSAAIMVSVFVGKDYQSNLLHKTNGPVSVTK
jgi:N-sulfoglucosamine sulfohydrolase